jgi:hypothetical protein
MEGSRRQQAAPKDGLRLLNELPAYTCFLDMT